jgi:hypothetical protein
MRGDLGAEALRSRGDLSSRLLRGVFFRDAREFLGKYEGMVDRERGECTCESGEIETVTIDGSGVILDAHVPRGRKRVNGR